MAETRATKASLGIVAISYNEEKDMPGFLANFLPWVDEIVIVDDGSSDQTEALALGGGEKVKFLRSPRKAGEYYADQRNKGIDASSADWILHLDIDERATPAFAQEVLRAIFRAECEAFYYRRENYFLNRPMRGGGWADWNQVHLAKREVLRFSGMFHENVELLCASEKVGQLTQRILHINDDDYAERLQKSTNYQTEVVQDVRNNEGQMNSWLILRAFVREFLIKYFYKRGYRDGTAGLIWAFHAAAAAFRARALVWDTQNRISREALEAEIQSQWEEVDCE
ncbi:glycosyltransferase family 2 protein [Rubritalea marina]|uniref:glycosyltransferase family 2 protein n=1 Tax=Rubritalea marina TaxID=361055 RepID=UPI0003752AF4|nr:glycosyltransferase family 2 protein [Rubritalea marina]